MGYAGTNRGYFGYTRVGYRVPLPLEYTLGYPVPGYRTLLFWSYSGIHPGSRRAYILLGTRIPNASCFGHTWVCTLLVLNTPL